MRDFSRIPGLNHKKWVVIVKSAKQQFLLTNFRVITSILGVLGRKLHFSGTEPVTFLGAQSSLGGHNSRFGGKQWFGGQGLELPPVASGLLQVYNNLSNCNYLVFVEDIPLEIGFIEEVRTIWGNKEVPQTFSHTILYLRKYRVGQKLEGNTKNVLFLVLPSNFWPTLYIVICLTPYDWQPCIRNFMTLQKT